MGWRVWYLVMCSANDGSGFGASGVVADAAVDDGGDAGRALCIGSSTSIFDRVLVSV